MSSPKLLAQDGDQYKAQSLYEPLEHPKESEGFLAHSSRPIVQSKHPTGLFSVLWPLLIHGLLTAITVAFMLFYVNDRTFNVSDRRPIIRLHDGTTVPWIYFAPLQTDITTVISASIAVLRLVAAGWLGPLCWRCALILLEETGLKPEQLRNLISYGIATVPPHGVTKNKRAKAWLIWFLLAVTIPVHLSGPILTGSVTWLPGHHRPQKLSNSTIAIPVFNGYSNTWSDLSEHQIRQTIARFAASLAFLTWGHEGPTNSTALRRYLPELRLGINGTLKNITLPYFSIQSIEWVNNPKSTLTEEQLNILGFACPRIITESDNCFSTIEFGEIILIPDTLWSNWAQPKREIIFRRGLMVMVVGEFEGNSSSESSCDFRTHNDGQPWNKAIIGLDNPIYVTGNPRPDSWTCYIFAWVTYTAGAITCRDCPISSRTVTQSDSILSVEPDFLTETSLQFMPNVANQTRQIEYINMRPTWKDFNQYVTGMLIHSYVASWMALTGYFRLHHADTTYSISAPASKASVNILRLYVWLGLQSLVTLSGLLFIYVQSRTSTPVVSDTTLTAFYLDTSAIYEYGGRYKAPIMRRVEFEGDRLRLKTE